MSVVPTKMLYRYLDTNGDGTGTKNAIGDYSAATTTFYYEAAKLTQIERVMFSIRDGSNIKPETYGAGSALTNGYTLAARFRAGGTMLDFCDGLLIKTNADVGRFCFDVDVKDWGTTPTDEFLLGRFTISRSGSPLILDKGQSLAVTLSDDFSGLIEHYFQIQGKILR